MKLSESVYVMLEDHPELGKIFVLRVNNNGACVFDVQTKDGVVEDGQLTLRLSKETALAMVQYVDDTMDEEHKNAMDVVV